MTRQNKKLILFAFTIIIYSSCSLSESELKGGWWKYGEGYHVEDVIDFNKGYSTNQDTLLQNGQRIGIIVNKSKSIFGYNKIEIASLDGRKSGIYYQK